MARVTVEDCIEKLPNRFELIMISSQRARKIGSGAALTVDRDNDKNPVVSLREIAESTVSTDDLKEDLIRSNQRVIHLQPEEADIIDTAEGEKEWEALAAQAAQQNLADEFGMIDDGDEADIEGEEESGGLEDMAGLSEKDA